MQVPPAKPATKAPEPPKRSYVVPVVAIGAIAVAALVFKIASALMWGDSVGPRMTRADFEAARERWAKSAISSYDLDLSFTGGEHHKEVHLEVRDGEVTKCTENGRTPTQQSTWDDWTIANQFEMIADDLAKSEDPRGGFKTRSNVMITLHADFDPTDGFPQRYQRKARGASPLACQWRVQNFRPQATAGAAPGATSPTAR